ncbi:hypothetical protein GCM10007216_04350 [Thalassobacillus devorans]|uniref:Uncharacterized protein n=1 Tax=Thalassobacillus devorans TaxID=279813 RepID=A0ABQ1NL87_9BACI|nr:hypothetical protein [Thalassobacillus devorans]NIK27343.1 hypothetical protein [Thalassobacillus devorans]GGC76970.1 hypothetical protein GCM10007216_04350 [Thalassobacillus devorans]
MKDKNEQHPILDDPYAKPVKFTWFDGLFFLVMFVTPFITEVGIVLVFAIAFYARAVYDLLRKKSLKGTLMEAAFATLLLIAWKILA